MPNSRLQDRVLETYARSLMEAAKAEGRDIKFVGTVVGTKHDPQDYDRSVEILREAGAIVESSNARAVRAALAFKGIDYVEEDREVVPYEIKDTSPLPEPSEAVMELAADH